MNKIYKNEKGFSATEAVLVLVIVALIGVVGYMVYMNHHKTPTVTSSSVAAVNKSPAATTKPVDPTSSWYLYNSPGNVYAMRIPDGWSLVQNGTNDNSPLLLYPTSANSNELAINKGTKGTVTVQAALGRDAPPTLSIQPYSLADATSQGVLTVSEAAKKASLQTSSGLTIDKYYSYTAQAPTNISQPPQGTTYTYIVKNSTSAVITTYYYPIGSTDYHANVEEALETLNLN